MFTWSRNECRQSDSCHELQCSTPICPSCQTQTDCVISFHCKAKTGCSFRQPPSIMEAFSLRPNNKEQHRSLLFPDTGLPCQDMSCKNAWRSGKPKVFIRRSWQKASNLPKWQYFLPPSCKAICRTTAWISTSECSSSRVQHHLASSQDRWAQYQWH